jgi:hypothetical protein
MEASRSGTAAAPQRITHENGGRQFTRRRVYGRARTYLGSIAVLLLLFVPLIPFFRPIEASLFGLTLRARVAYPEWPGEFGAHGALPRVALETVRGPRYFREGQEERVEAGGTSRRCALRTPEFAYVLEAVTAR